MGITTDDGTMSCAELCIPVITIGSIFGAGKLTEWFISKISSLPMNATDIGLIADNVQFVSEHPYLSGSIGLLVGGIIANSTLKRLRNPKISTGMNWKPMYREDRRKNPQHTISKKLAKNISQRSGSPSIRELESIIHLTGKSHMLNNHISLMITCAGLAVTRGREIIAYDSRPVIDIDHNKTYSTYAFTNPHCVTSTDESKLHILYNSVNGVDQLLVNEDGTIEQDNLLKFKGHIANEDGTIAVYAPPVGLEGRYLKKDMKQYRDDALLLNRETGKLETRSAYKSKAEKTLETLAA